jgi:hypothetical protein
MLGMITINFKKSNKNADTTKDCKCKIHEGAHYLFIDELWHQQNQELLRRADLANKNGDVQAAMQMIQNFSQSEIARMREKEKGADDYRWKQQEKQRRELYKMAGDF